MNDTNEPHVLLQGERLALGAPRREMLPAYHRWENDPSTLLGYGNQFPQAWEVRENGWEGQRKNRNYQQFEILDGTEAVGMTILIVNGFVHTAEYVIVIAPEHRGKGYATEATRLTLDYGFHLGGLRMIHLKVLEPNAAGIKAYEKAGFREVGRLRRSGFWLGKDCAEILMDALPEEFAGPSAVQALTK
uniref:GNAT family N-acetyltransferase n=1 Tax=Streptomyces sp. NBC_00049 TaxID=2903617 RepID=A0AAU2JIV9_9ACTN